MSNKGNSIGSGIIGGGSGSGGITIGSAVSGGTPSTLLWVDSGGLVQSGVTATASATTLATIGNANPTTLRLFNSQIATVFNGDFAFSNSGGSADFLFDHNNGRITIRSGSTFAWTSSSTDATNGNTNTADTSFNRLAAGIIGVTSWIQNTGGEATLNANYTNATATFSNTALSRTVISGRTYNFECNLFISESTAVDGWQLDFNGGSAAMTNFVCHAESIAETGIIVVLANATSAALATVLNATTTVTTGGQVIKICGSFVPSGAGTFILRAAQNTHSTGTLTIKRGSNMILRDSPAL